MAQQKYNWVQNRHGVTVPRDGIVDQVDGKRERPDHPRHCLLLVRVLVDTHERWIERYQESEHEDGISDASTLEPPPHHNRHHTDEEDGNFLSIWLSEHTPSESIHKRQDSGKGSYDILKSMSDASDFGEREQVEDGHESPDAPADNVGLAVAAFRLHVVKDVPSTVKQRCDHPKDPWEMLHYFLLLNEFGFPCRWGLE